MRSKVLLGIFLGFSCLSLGRAQTLDELKAKYGADLVIGEKCLLPDTHQFCSPVCKYGLPEGSGPMRCATKAEYDQMQAALAKQVPQPSVADQINSIDAYYAYVEVNQVDTHLSPIRNKARQQMVTRFCLMWEPGWDLNNPNKILFSSDPNKVFYRHFSYRIDPNTHVLTMYALDAPAVLAENNGAEPKPLGGIRRYKANIKAQMYPEPRSEWPCTQRDWAIDMRSVQYRTVPSGGGGGRYIPHFRPVPHTPIPPHPCITHWYHAGC